MCATIRLILILQPLFHIFPQNFPLRSHAPWCFSSCLRMVYQNELRKSGRPRKPGQSSKTNHLLRILRLTESLLQESANQRLPGTTNETASRPAERTTEVRCLFAPYSRPPDIIKEIVAPAHPLSPVRGKGTGRATRKQKRCGHMICSASQRGVTSTLLVRGIGWSALKQV